MPEYQFSTSLCLAGEAWDRITDTSKTCALMLYFGDEAGHACSEHFFVWSSKETAPASLMKTGAPGITPKPEKKPKEIAARINQERIRQANWIAIWRSFARRIDGEPDPPVGHAEELMYREFPTCLSHAVAAVGDHKVTHAYIYLSWSPCRDSKNLRLLPEGCLEKLGHLATQHPKIEFRVKFIKVFKGVTAAIANKWAGSHESRANIKFEEIAAAQLPWRNLQPEVSHPNKPETFAPSSSSAPSNNDVAFSSSAPND